MTRSKFTDYLMRRSVRDTIRWKIYGDRILHDRLVEFLRGSVDLWVAVRRGGLWPW